MEQRCTCSSHQFTECRGRDSLGGGWYCAEEADLRAGLRADIQQIKGEADMAKTWEAMARRAAEQDGVEYVGPNTIFAVSDKLRADLAQKREALELLVADVEPYDAWQRPCYALEVAKAALATPAADWLTAHDAQVREPLEREIAALRGALEKCRSALFSASAKLTDYGLGEASLDAVCPELTEADSLAELALRDTAATAARYDAGVRARAYEAAKAEMWPGCDHDAVLDKLAAAARKEAEHE